LCINFDINGFGYTLGDLFTNSPGHPVHQQQFLKIFLAIAFISLFATHKQCILSQKHTTALLCVS
jgi:hypothetical protein